jgi:hypothetical protein
VKAAAVEAELLLPFAPAEQMGAGEPLGFFDLLGFAKVADESGLDWHQAGKQFGNSASQPWQPCECWRQVLFDSGGPHWQDCAVLLQSDCEGGRC